MSSRITKHNRHSINRISVDIENTAIEANAPNITNGTNDINRGEDMIHQNVVEKYLQSIFKPMDVMQNLFVCARYKIQDNVITPNSKIYSGLSICTVIILMAFLYSMLFITANRTSLEVFNYLLANILNFILYFVGGFLNAFTNILQRLNNVLFVLKIQSVHRFLSVNGRSFKSFTICNWMCVIAVNCFHIVWMCMYFYAFYEVGITDIMASYFCCIRFDMNMIYATRSMILVYNSLKSWIEELRRSGYIDVIEDDQHWDNMFESYTDILQVFKIFEKTFSGLVLFYIIHTSINALMDVYVRVEMRTIADRGEIQYVFLACMALTWVIKNVLLMTSLSMESEKFYSAVKEVQSTCVLILTSGRCSETRKRFCKNIQRVQFATFEKMNVCGLLTIDAEMPLRVLDLITTYTIVLLQFEFL